jgi:hypothetical protein
LIVLTSSVVAKAQSMDPTIDRLILKESSDCRTASGAIHLPSAGQPYGPCLPDNAAFHRLISQYAFALAPTAMHSARTTGLGGFHVSLEAVYTSIDSNSSDFRLGSRGSATLAENNASNSNPARLLQLYSLKVRKGFGYGFELAAQTGFMPQTSMWSTGADVRLSLLEGFRKGIPGFIPDIALGGGVRTITGASQFQLTIASFDTQISKPFVVSDSVVITPWIGFQQLFTFIDSHVIDFTPRTDEASLCDSQGAALPGQAGASSDGYTGSTLCSSHGSEADYNNNRTFKSARIERQRLLLGANIRHEILSFGAQFIMDLTKPGDAQNNATNKSELSSMPRQWSMVLDAGLIF